MAKREQQLVSPPPEGLDPFENYHIMAHNPDYSGSVGAATFRDGEARLSGLPVDADEVEQDERRALLLFFCNAHRTQVPDEVWDAQRRTMVFKGTFRSEPTYVLFPEVSGQRLKRREEVFPGWAPPEESPQPVRSKQPVANAKQLAEV